MNYKIIRTSNTIKRDFDKVDYSYDLEFNGVEMTLKGRWHNIGNGSRGSSFATLDESDADLIKKVFHGLELECIQYDGTPTFNRDGERMHLVHAECVNMGTDMLEI